MTVGEGAIVGVGAVVLRDIPARVTVLGNPARIANAPGQGCKPD
jgi:acetyltransferase-like isoleucine patch superfamily enzyme